jgi:hypothetical protein
MLTTMSENRRIAERVRVNLNARWQGCFDQQEGSVADISTSGCFILTSGEVTPMELIDLEIQLPTERWIRLFGQVIYHIEDMGFGLRFAVGGDDNNELKLLTHFIEYARETV